MKRALILCLALVTLLAFDSSAEAGRRKERRAARKGGGGVYAGAYQGRSSGGGGYAVAKTSYAEPTVAAPIPAQPTPTVAAADLTITEITTERNALCFTVKNVGQVASPETRMQIVITDLQAASAVRVVSLLPNQAVKIRVTSLPTSNIQADAWVDPDDLVVELDEENNGLRMTVGASASAEPPTLSESQAWPAVGG